MGGHSLDQQANAAFQIHKGEMYAIRLLHIYALHQTATAKHRAATVW